MSRHGIICTVNLDAMGDPSLHKKSVRTDFFIWNRLGYQKSVINGHVTRRSHSWSYHEETCRISKIPMSVSNDKLPSRLCETGWQILKMNITRIIQTWNFHKMNLITCSKVSRLQFFSCMLHASSYTKLFGTHLKKPHHVRIMSTNLSEKAWLQLISPWQKGLYDNANNNNDNENYNKMPWSFALMSKQSQMTSLCGMWWRALQGREYKACIWHQ